VSDHSQASLTIQQPPSFWRRVAGDARRASLSAMAISLALHACFLIIAMLVVVGGGGGGGDGSGGGGEPGPIEMAVITEGELAQIEDRSMGLQTPSVPDALGSAIEVDINIPDVGPAAGGGGESLGEIGSLAGGGDISLGGFGGGGLGGSGGGGGANFFGLEAQGNRFAYIVDISGSMDQPVASANEGTRIMALKSELSRSINGLLENSQFIVITFSSDAATLTEKREWVTASPAGKRRMAPLIYGMTAGGGTNPLPAFEIVFSMKPRPDAIYFMTDGEFDPSVVEAVAAFNERSRIPIHCIGLGPAAATEHMRKIAKTSRGTFISIGGKP